MHSFIHAFTASTALIRYRHFLPSSGIKLPNSDNPSIPLSWNPDHTVHKLHSFSTVSRSPIPYRYRWLTPHWAVDRKDSISASPALLLSFVFWILTAADLPCCSGWFSTVSNWIDLINLNCLSVVASCDHSNLPRQFGVESGFVYSAQLIENYLWNWLSLLRKSNTDLSQIWVLPSFWVVSGVMKVSWTIAIEYKWVIG